MFLLQPLSVLVLILFHTATVQTDKSQDGRLVFSRSFLNPGLREQAMMMMTKRGLAEFPVRWYNGKPGRTWFTTRLNKPQPPAPTVVPAWCHGNREASKTIARARKLICPEPSKIEKPRNANFGISYGKG